MVIFGVALIGFRGLLRQALSEKPNSFLRPLKKKGFKEVRVTTMGLYDIGKSHDRGIQQEPAAKLRAHLLWDSPPPARHGKRRSSSARARTADSP
jgi:hypothetical protein